MLGAPYMLLVKTVTTGKHPVDINISKCEKGSPSHLCPDINLQSDK